jgi:hypothetical protein
LRKFKITLLLKRNLDISLPASHVVELTFHLLPDFAGGGIGNVPGILTKSDELARGTALAGLSVKVTDGFFMVGLSDTATERERNLHSLECARHRRDRKGRVRRAGIQSRIHRLGPVSRDGTSRTGRHCAGRCTGQPLMAAVVPEFTSSRSPSNASEADAEASDKVLQDKFPSVLGHGRRSSPAPMPARAEHFYRAAVGPFDTADEASQFCATLKAAGGQCVVQRN